MQSARGKAERIHFTKAALNRLEVLDFGRYVYDAQGGGLALYVGINGSKTFIWYRKIGGKPERIKLGAWPEITIEQARRAVASHNGTRAEGNNPAVKNRIR